MALIGPWDLSLAPEWLGGGGPSHTLISNYTKGKLFHLFSPQGLSEVLTSPDCTWYLPHHTQNQGE